MQIIWACSAHNSGNVFKTECQCGTDRCNKNHLSCDKNKNMCLTGKEFAFPIVNYICIVLISTCSFFTRGAPISNDDTDATRCRVYALVSPLSPREAWKYFLGPRASLLHRDFAFSKIAGRAGLSPRAAMTRTLSEGRGCALINFTYPRGPIFFEIYFLFFCLCYPCFSRCLAFFVPFLFGLCVCVFGVKSTKFAPL